MTTLSADRPWIEDRSRVVRDVFERERSNLLPLPDEHFPVHDRLDVEIGKTRYARFDLNDYSVPHDRTRRTLTVLADIETVRISESQFRREPDRIAAKIANLLRRRATRSS
jgi:hypothetical protein